MLTRSAGFVLLIVTLSLVVWKKIGGTWIAHRDTVLGWLKGNSRASRRSYGRKAG